MALGTLVLGKIQGHPWWPAQVSFTLLALSANPPVLTHACSSTFLAVTANLPAAIDAAS